MGFLNWRALRKHNKTVNSIGVASNASTVKAAKKQACLFFPKGHLCERDFMRKTLCRRIKLNIQK